MPSNSCWTRSSYDSTNFAKTFGLLRLWCRMWNLSYANGNGLCLSERVSMYSIDRFIKPRLQRKDRLGDGVTSSGPAWVHSLSAILQHASSGWRLGYFPFYWTFKVLVTLTKVFPADSWRSEVWWTWPHPGREEAVNPSKVGLDSEFATSSGRVFINCLGLRIAASLGSICFEANLDRGKIFELHHPLSNSSWLLMWA